VTARLMNAGHLRIRQNIVKQILYRLMIAFSIDFVCAYSTSSKHCDANWHILR